MPGCLNADPSAKVWQNSRAKLNCLIGTHEPDGHMIQPPSTLEDHLRPGLRVLFVGINPGLRSATVGHHFAGHSNHFWKLLLDSRLINEPLTYRDDWRLPEWGLGLTNIISRTSVGIDVLSPAEYRSGLVILEQKIRRYQPKIIALLGVTIFRTLFDEAANVRLLQPGPTRARLADVPVFLLPNPSGRNAHFPYQTMLGAFKRLRKLAHAD